MSENAEERKNFFDFLNDFTKKNDIKFGFSKIDLQFELCVDLDGNIVEQSNNKVIVRYNG